MPVSACWLCGETSGSGYWTRKHRLNMSARPRLQQLRHERQTPRRCGQEFNLCVSHPTRLPPMSRGSDHILIPFPVSSTLVSGWMKITDIAGMRSWAASQRNCIFLPLKRLKGAKEGCLRRAAALQHPTGIPSRLSKAWRISQIKGCSV